MWHRGSQSLVFLTRRRPQCENEFGNKTGLDNSCNGETRAKQFALTELPPAWQGVLYRDKNGTQPVVLGFNSMFNKTGEKVVYFKPAKNYFNRESYPLAGNKIPPAATYSILADPNSLDADACEPAPVDMPDTCAGKKVGPSAKGEQFTVTDMDGNVMGCNNQSTVSSGGVAGHAVAA